MGIIGSEFQGVPAGRRRYLSLLFPGNMYDEFETLSLSASGALGVRLLHYRREPSHQTIHSLRWWHRRKVWAHWGPPTDTYHEARRYRSRDLGGTNASFSLSSVGTLWTRLGLWKCPRWWEASFGAWPQLPRGQVVGFSVAWAPALRQKSPRGPIPCRHSLPLRGQQKKKKKGPSLVCT